MKAGNQMFNFIKDHWEIILAILIAIFSTSVNIYKFSKLPKDEQTAKVKVWLLEKVTWAQKKLGEDTGKLKRSLVYGLFIAAFPKIGIRMPISLFDILLDSAIAEMKDILSKSENALKYVNTPESTTESEVTK
jgi:hypothetical protein